MLRDDGVLGQAAHRVHRQRRFRRRGAAASRRRRARPAAGSARRTGAEIVPSAGAVGTRAARHDERADDPRPDRRPATSSPAPATVPEISCPSTAGTGNATSPFSTCRSVWQTPQAATRTSDLAAARLRHRNPLDRERLPGPGQHGRQHRPGKCSHFAHEFAQGTYSPSRKAVNAVGRRGRVVPQLTPGLPVCTIAKQQSSLSEGDMNIASRGATMAVDWEQRVDFDRLRTPPARPREGGAGGLRPRRAAALRPEQPPLRDEHGDRDMGARQEHPLRAACSATRIRSSGTSARRRATISSTARGFPSRAGGPGCRRCAARCRDATGVPDALAADDLRGAARARPRAASRSAWTFPT